MTILPSLRSVIELLPHFSIPFSSCVRSRSILAVEPDLASTFAPGEHPVDFGPCGNPSRTMPLLIGSRMSPFSKARTTEINFPTRSDYDRGALDCLPPCLIDGPARIAGKVGRVQTVALDVDNLADAHAHPGGHIAAGPKAVSRLSDDFSSHEDLASHGHNVAVALSIDFIALIVMSPFFFMVISASPVLMPSRRRR